MSSNDNRLERLSSTWLEKFTTCLDQRSTQPLTSDHISSLLTSDDIPALLCAIGTPNFKSDSNKLQILTRLCNVLQDSPDSRHQFLHAGGLPILVHFVVINPDDPTAHTIAYRAIAAISDHNGTPVQALIASEVIEVVCESCTKFNDNSTFVRTAVVIFKILSSYEVLRKHMQTYTVIVSLFEIFKHLMCSDPKLDSAPLCIATLMSIIASLVYQSSVCRVIVEENSFILLILHAMEKYKLSEDVQYCGALAIKNSIYQCPSNVRCFLDGKGLDVMFSNIAAYPESKPVLRHSVGTILNTVMSSDDAKKAILLKEDFLIGLCNAFITETIDLDVAYPFISVWVYLCEYDVGTDRIGVSNVANSVIKTGATTMIHECLRFSHESRKADLFLDICHLKNLLLLVGSFRQPKDKASIKRFEDSVGIFMEALETFKDAHHMTVPILQILEDTMSGHDDCKIKFNQVSGISKIVSVMRQNRRNAVVNDKCCKVLDTAAEGQLAISAIVEGKEAMCAAIMTCMADFSDNASVIDHACSLLIKIAVRSKADANRLVEAGARNMVQMAQMKHQGNAVVESLTNQLMALLADVGTENRAGQMIGPRGTAGQRMRSRSRTIEDPSSVRTRANLSKSPVRVGKSEGSHVARESRDPTRTLRRRDLGRPDNGGENDSEDQVSRSVVTSRVRVRRATRQKMTLEPVYEG